MLPLDGYSVNICGTGNVASVLSRALSQRGCWIKAVYGRNPEKARELAGSINNQSAHRTTWTSDASQLPDDSDFSIICVSDKAVGDVAAQLSHMKGIVAHTAGCVDISVLNPCNCGKAVLYPLQTFSRGRFIDTASIPFFIEAENALVLEKIKNFVSTLTDHVYEADSEKRKEIHLAGVYACNFVNAMLGCAEEAMKRAGLPREALAPIARETVEKFISLGAGRAQTGPAARNDTEVIHRHLRLISDDVWASELYKAASLLIANKFSKK